MERRSPTLEPSAVLGTVKAAPPPAVAKRPALTVPARGARASAGRDEGMPVAVEQRNWKEKRSKVFGWATTPAPSEAKSPRRDDGPGQTVAHPVALPPRTRRLVGLPLRTPSCGGLAPTTDRSEHPAIRQRKKGIDHRPVTEGWAKARRAPCPRGSGSSRRDAHGARRVPRFAHPASPRSTSRTVAYTIPPTL